MGRTKRRKHKHHTRKRGVSVRRTGKRKRTGRRKQTGRRRRTGSRLAGAPSGPVRRGRKTEFDSFNAQTIVDDIVENRIGPLEDNIAECEMTRRRLEEEREAVMQNAVDNTVRLNGESQENDRLCDNLQKDLDKIQKDLHTLNNERNRLSASPVWW